MSALLVFTPDVRETLSGLSNPGRDRLVLELEFVLRNQPLAEASSRHFHAAGMCCVVERAGGDERRVVYLSPACREG